MDSKPVPVTLGKLILLSQRDLVLILFLGAKRNRVQTKTEMESGFLEHEENMSILKDHMLIWDVPLPSNSHHQDYSIFSRESLYINLHLWLLLMIFCWTFLSHWILLELPKLIRYWDFLLRSKDWESNMDDDGDGWPFYTHHNRFVKFMEGPREKIVSRQFIATSAEVTPKGSLVRNPTQNGLKSG